MSVASNFISFSDSFMQRSSLLCASLSKRCIADKVFLGYLCGVLGVESLNTSTVEVLIVKVGIALSKANQNLLLAIERFSECHDQPTFVVQSNNTFDEADGANDGANDGEDGEDGEEVLERNKASDGEENSILSSDDNSEGYLYRLRMLKQQQG